MTLFIICVLFIPTYWVYFIWFYCARTMKVNLVRPIIWTERLREKEVMTCSNEWLEPTCLISSTCHKYNHTMQRVYLLGGVLLLGRHTPELVVQRLSVVQVLHLVDPDQPVLWSERLLQVLELDVLVADLGVACSVEARRCPEVQLAHEKKKIHN